MATKTRKDAVRAAADPDGDKAAAAAAKKIERGRAKAREAKPLEDAKSFDPDRPSLTCLNCGAVFQADAKSIDKLPTSDGPDHRWRDAIDPTWTDHQGSCSPDSPYFDDDNALAYV